MNNVEVGQRRVLGNFYGDEFAGKVVEVKELHVNPKGFTTVFADYVNPTANDFDKFMDNDIERFKQNELVSK